MSLAIAAQPAPSAGVAAFLRRPARLLIGGEWVPSAANERIPVIDPATGAEVASIADANRADVDKAVAAAREAFERGPWSTMLPAQREALIWRLADLIDEHADELAELESIDNGKTKQMAGIVDVPGARNYFRYMAGWATKIEGSTIDVSVGGLKGARINAYTRREPVGVVAQIIPWNFPLVMAAWKLGPALAAGCTCILKPAEQTPLTALTARRPHHRSWFPARRRQHPDGLRRDRSAQRSSRIPVSTRSRSRVRRSSARRSTKPRRTR